MAIENDQIRDVVRRVVGAMLDQDKISSSSGIGAKSEGISNTTGTGKNGIFETIDEAFAAVECAQKQFRSLSIAVRKNIIEEIRKACRQNARLLSEMAVEESRMGRVSDKMIKHMLTADKTPGVEEVPSGAFIGDYGLTTEEPAAFGTILAIAPTTNPTSTIFNNSITMLAAGNTVFFAPHPRALKTSLKAISIVNDAIKCAGGPENLVVSLSTVKMDTVKELMGHKKIALLCVTGGDAVVDQAMRMGKRVIGAAAGNPPALVDDTADPEKAARDIIAGHSFDNNLPCIAEKEVIVTAGMADRLMAAFRARDNAIVLDASQLPKLESIVLKEDRSGPHPKMIGQNANVILKEMGINAPDSLRAIIVETDKDHPFVRHELMLPVLPVVRSGTFEEAMELAIEVEAGLHHSAIIHSSNIYHMSAFGRAINTTIFVKNAPSFAGIGYGGEGHTGFTIAGRTGEGIVTPRTFTRIRRCTLVGAFQKS